jgi:hypothetical protein
MLSSRLSEAGAAGWLSSVTQISAACRNGRRECRWSATCSTRSSAKLGALCSDIAAHLDSSAASSARSESDEISYRSLAGRVDWWPPGLGRPAAVGAQNDLRYAVFPETRRLVIDDRGAVSVYDTGNDRIFGVAQAQSSDRTISFTSEDGLVRIADLAKVAV